MARRQMMMMLALVAHAAHGALSDFHMHAHTIGPVDEQYNGTLFPCKGLNASVCLTAAAAFCEARGWCRSFAVEDGGARGESVQVYHADWNESLPGHPRWTLYALGTQPPPPPAQPTPSPPPPPPAPPIVSYCELKGLMQQYAEQLIPGSALVASAVHDALQLGAQCGQSQPQPQPQPQSQSQASPPSAAAAAAAAATLYSSSPSTC